MTLLPPLGAGKTFPNTMALAHWNPTLIDADDVLEAARVEVDQAINEAFGP